MRLYIITCCIILFASCKQQYNFERDKLVEAWQNNDSSYVIAWVDNLRAVSDFNQFAVCVADLAHETNFCYGYLDLEKKWDTVPNKKKEILRNNIITVYELYYNSKIFMDKNVPWDTTIQIQKQFFPIDRKLNESELEEINRQFNEWHTQFN